MEMLCKHQSPNGLSGAINMHKEYLRFTIVTSEVDCFAQTINVFTDIDQPLRTALMAVKKPNRQTEWQFCTNSTKPLDNEDCNRAGHSKESKKRLSKSSTYHIFNVRLKTSGD